MFILISDPTQVPPLKVVSVVTALEFELTNFSTRLYSTWPSCALFMLSVVVPTFSHFIFSFLYFYQDVRPPVVLLLLLLLFPTPLLSHIYYLVCWATTFGSSIAFFVEFSVMLSSNLPIILFLPRKGRMGVCPWPMQILNFGQYYGHNLFVSDTEVEVEEAYLIFDRVYLVWNSSLTVKTNHKLNIYLKLINNNSSSCFRERSFNSTWSFDEHD